MSYSKITSADVESLVGRREEIGIYNILGVLLPAIEPEGISLHEIIVESDNRTWRSASTGKGGDLIDLLAALKSCDDRAVGEDLLRGLLYALAELNEATDNPTCYEFHDFWWGVPNGDFALSGRELLAMKHTVLSRWIPPLLSFRRTVPN